MNHNAASLLWQLLSFRTFLHPKLGKYNAILMTSCTKKHNHGVKRESGVKNKWTCERIRSVELFQSTIFIDFGKFLFFFWYFWHPCPAAVGPNEQKILPKMYQIKTRKIKNRNLLVISRDLLYLQRVIFIRFWSLFSLLKLMSHDISYVV